MLAGKLIVRRHIALVQIDEPQLPAADVSPGQILFQQGMTCRCGSDLPFFDGDFEGHLFFGVPAHSIDGVKLRTALFKNLVITTSIHPDFERTFPLAMQWIAEGRVNLQPLITHRFLLSEIQQAFDTFRDRVDGVQKVLVEFPSWSVRK